MSRDFKFCCLQGVCRVIKRLPAAKPNVTGLRDVADKCNYEDKSHFSNNQSNVTAACFKDAKMCT